MNDLLLFRLVKRFQIALQLIMITMLIAMITDPIGITLCSNTHLSQIKHFTLQNYIKAKNKKFLVMNRRIKGYE